MSLPTPITTQAVPMSAGPIPYRFVDAVEHEYEVIDPQIHPVLDLWSGGPSSTISGLHVKDASGQEVVLRLEAKAVKQLSAILGPVALLPGVKLAISFDFNTYNIRCTYPQAALKAQLPEDNFRFVSLNYFPGPTICRCDIKNLLSTGHDRDCPEKKS